MNIKATLIVGGDSGGIGSNICKKINSIEGNWATIPGKIDVFDKGPDGKAVLRRRELDVTSSESIRKYLTEHGPFDSIVYTAAANRPRMASDTTMSSMEQDFKVNVFGFVELMTVHEALFPGVVTSVVAITSDAARIPMRGSMSYCASKAALSQTIKVMAKEHAGYIRVNGVAPTSIEGTPMTSEVNRQFAATRGMNPEEALAYELKSLPMGRKVTGDEVAQVVVDVLFGPEYLTGSIVEIMGGKG